MYSFFFPRDIYLVSLCPVLHQTEADSRDQNRHGVCPHGVDTLGVREEGVQTLKGEQYKIP